MKNNRPSFPFVVLFKWPGILLLVVTYAATGFLLGLLPLTGRARRAVRTRVTSFFSGLVLALFCVRVHTRRRERMRPGRHGRLVVANHLSYVDVLVLSSLSPLVFITSVEMKHTPLLGQLAKWGGSLFVERRRPAGLRQEIADIARVLKEGVSVVLFPEGTTSNGERVHPFKRALFDAAITDGAEILPVCLRYTGVNGGPVTRENRDSLFFHGGVRFSEHFPRFLALRSVDVELVALKTITATADASRKELAALAHEYITDAYGERQG